ncbi:MAG: hypothetical protein AAGE52_34290 [Myxococcota bacterium]
MREPNPRIPLLLLLLGCSPCGEEAALVDGPHPYRRCAFADPWEGAFTHGELQLEGEGRALRVQGLTQWAAFGASEAAGSRLEGLEAMPLMILGGPRDEAGWRALLEATGDRLVFVLPGGEDDPEVLAELLEEEERWVNLMGVHELRLDHGTFVVLPGSRDGRYSLGRGCGFAESDLAALSLAEGAPRWWLSWMTPRSEGPRGPDVGFGEVHAGDEALAAFGQAQGITGGIFAWPTTTAGTVSRNDGADPVADEAVTDLSAVVPRLGEAVERFDGALLPSGVLLVDLDGEGLRAGYRPL